MTARWIAGLLVGALIIGCVEVLRRYDRSAVARDMRATRGDL